MSFFTNKSLTIVIDVNDDDLGFFRFNEVLVADGGNGFFESLVFSTKLLNMEWPHQLRNCLVRWMMTNQAAKDLYYHMILHDHDDDFEKSKEFETFIQKILNSDTSSRLGSSSWVDDSAVALFICFLFGVNICIISPNNDKDGFHVHDTRKWLQSRQENFILDTAPTIYLFHYLYQTPFERSSTTIQCNNHYGYLCSIEKSQIGLRDIVYDNKATVLNEPVKESKEDKKKDQQVKVTRTRVAKGRKELDWNGRSNIIYFYLHPLLGKKNYDQTANVFQISPRTIEGWITKVEMKKRWTCLVNQLNFDDVVNAMPESKLKDELQTMSLDENAKTLSPVETPECMKLYTENSKDVTATDEVYVKGNDKRIGRQAPTRKYVHVQDFIAKTVQHQWSIGLPVTKEELRKMVLNHAQKLHSKCGEDWLLTYGQETRQSNKKLIVFLTRAISKAGFTTTHHGGPARRNKTIVVPRTFAQMFTPK